MLVYVILSLFIIPTAGKSLDCVYRDEDWFRASVYSVKETGIPQLHDQWSKMNIDSRAISNYDDDNNNNNNSNDNNNRWWWWWWWW